MTHDFETSPGALIEANARRSLERDFGLRSTATGGAGPGLPIVRPLPSRDRVSKAHLDPVPELPTGPVRRYTRVLRGLLQLLDWIGRLGSQNIWLQMHRLDRSDMGDDA